MLRYLKQSAQRWVTQCGGLMMATLVYRWMGTLNYKAVYYDRSVDPTLPEYRGPVIIVFWHEYIPFLFHLRSHNRFAMLVSQHRDADWLSEAARHCGFSTVRGSTNRGGSGAIRELIDLGRDTNLAITPDGPRGPRRKLALGPIYLSAKLGIPLVPIGMAYAQPWRLPTWDRFAIPKPFSRACAIAGPRIQIPATNDRDAIERYRESVETTLNTLTEEAQRWADGGRDFLGSRTALKALPYPRGASPEESPDDTLRLWRETA